MTKQIVCHFNFVIWICMGLWCLGFGISPLKAATYYVDSSGGNDSNSGTLAAPFLSIQRAADIAVAGDTVIVRDGTYHAAPGEPVVSLRHSGSSTAWINFRSENPGMAKLDGRNNTDRWGWYIYGGTTYVAIQGFEMFGFNTVGIELGSEGIHDVRITGNHIHDIGRICTDTSNGLDGIYIPQSTSITIEKNVIHDIGRLAAGENGCSPANAYYQNHDHGVYLNGVSNVIVKNNIFYNNRRGWSVHVYSGRGYPSSDLIIANNTFAFPNPYRDGQIVLSDPGVSNVSIQNNIFYSPRTAGVNIGGSAAVFSNVALSNNMTFGGVVKTGSSSGVTLANNFDNTDPLLMNPASLDFHLQQGSPAMDAGANLALVADDMDGNPRGAGGGWDIGAYEYGSGSSQTFSSAIDFDSMKTILNLARKETLMINYRTAGRTPVRLAIYDRRGTEVRVFKNAGSNSVEWDGRNESGSMVASGVYLLKLSAGDESIVKNAVVVK